DKLIAIARSDGLARLSLETGTNDRFAPAIALYTRRGFVAGEAFAHYANGPHNQCYHLELGEAAA
ncbi:MAG: N-acetyltransferase, partial [Pseudomonadota bacterium]|nr:N-acetyltransferase [Pseudomonadota bacterium]